MITKDDLVAQQDNFDRLKVYPFQNLQGEDAIFPARFELPQYNKDFHFKDAAFYTDSKVLGFIDFITGLPIECVEMLMIICENNKVDKVASKEAGEGDAAAPVPESFFEGYDEDKVLINILYLPPDNVQYLADNLAGESEPKYHWWLRYNHLEKGLSSGEAPKFPIPGELVCLGVRMMPDEPWGSQKSSPFLYSGNWMDTVFYTRGKIEQVIDPTDDTPYPTYKVRWRKDLYAVNPSDFAEYKVDDEVAILKISDESKDSQLWKDDDMKTFGEKWVIVPIAFYDLEKE